MSYPEKEINMNPKLCEAVRNRRIMVFSYKGKDRVVEPYAYGTGHHHQEIIKGYQTGGKSENPLPGWGVFPISEIKDLKITKTTFSVLQSDYQKDDKTFVNIYCEL